MLVLNILAKAEIYDIKSSSVFFNFEIMLG
jgi:hypothetical protein